MWECPDGMEILGVVGILEEAARLLQKHFRLFLLWICIFQSGAALGFLFLLRQATVCHRLPRSSFVGVMTFPSSLAEAGLQVEEEKYADNLHFRCNYSQSTLIRIYVGMLFFVIFGSMPLAVYAFVIEHIYRGAGTESNDDPITIIKKLSDKALLWIFVTLFFTCGMVWMIYGVCSTVGILGVLFGIVSDPAGNPAPHFQIQNGALVDCHRCWDDHVWAFTAYCSARAGELRPNSVETEPLLYWGRIFSIFCIALLCATIEGLIFASLRAIEYIEVLPVWLMIILVLLLISFHWVASIYISE